MLETWLYAIGSVLVVSLVSLVGVVTLSLGMGRLKRLLLVLVSLSVGTLFGSTFFHLIPEAFEKQGFGPQVPLWILGGLLLFFVLEKFIHWRHCHVPASSDHPHPVVFMNFVGDGLHNFIDGVLIGAAFLVDIPTGITTSVAVLVHEIPQEIGDFGTLVWGGLPVRKALMLNFASALFALLGAVLVLMMGPQVAGLEEQILPLTAGGFIYIAGSDLIPELRKNPGARDSAAQLAAILVGLALIFVLTRFLSHGHTDEAGDGHEHTFLSTPLVLVDKLPAC
jgi:zinc and cadmium transporter